MTPISKACQHFNTLRAAFLQWQSWTASAKDWLTDEGFMRAITDSFAVAGQLLPEDMSAVRAAGFSHVIHNRPDDEEPGLPTSADLASAASAVGLVYVYLPMISGALDPALMAPTRAVLESAQGSVLAFCRSGSRSTAMWAMTCASMGVDVGQCCDQAQAAGYDIAPLRPMLDAIANGS
jgi:uncharacterized protein (TIGR01244 family)